MKRKLFSAYYYKNVNQTEERERMRERGSDRERERGGGGGDGALDYDHYSVVTFYRLPPTVTHPLP